MTLHQVFFTYVNVDSLALHLIRSLRHKNTRRLYGKHVEKVTNIRLSAGSEHIGEKIVRKFINAVNRVRISILLVAMTEQLIWITLVSVHNAVPFVINVIFFIFLKVVVATQQGGWFSLSLMVIQTETNT